MMSKLWMASLIGTGLWVSPVLAQAPAVAGRGLFISPMGEAFRGAPARSLLQRWFDGADANHDSSLSLVEMRQDAARLFALLDLNHDGEIDPTELTSYESDIVPEVRVGALVADDGSDDYEGPDATQRHAGAMAESIDNHATAPKRAEPRQGAGRFGLLTTPNPVAAADQNFNRGISADEFARAARTRFGLLDANHDGLVRIDELPPLPTRAMR